MKNKYRVGIVSDYWFPSKNYFICECCKTKVYEERINIYKIPELCSLCSSRKQRKEKLNKINNL